MNNILIAALFLSVILISGVHAQQQPAQDDRPYTILGKCQVSNSINYDQAIAFQRQVFAMQEAEKAMAEYWEAYVKGINQPLTSSSDGPTTLTPDGPTELGVKLVPGELK